MSWAQVSPWSSEGLADPDAWTAWLRSHAPVHHLDADSIWVLSRHADVTAALRDHERFSSSEGNDRNSRHVDALPSFDPPDHTRLRRRLSAGFGPADVAQWRLFVEDSVRRAFGALPRTGRTFDAVAAVARAVPTDVLASMLDVEPRVVRSLADRPGSHRHQVLGRLVDRRTDELASGERAAGADLVCTLLAGDGAARSDVVSFLVLLLSAGIDTVQDFIAEVLLLVAREPEAMDGIGEGPGAASAADELLRWISPLQATFRSTRCPVHLHGREIPAGAKVMLHLGSANRDTTWRPDAGTLWLDGGASKGHGPHVALGAGVHRCLGASLAHAYATAVVDALRGTRLGLAGDPVRRANPAVRSLLLLPLRVLDNPRNAGA